MLPRDAIVERALSLYGGRVREGVGLGPDGKLRLGATPCVTPSEVSADLALETGHSRRAPGGHRAVEEALRAAGWRSLYVSGKRFFRPASFDGTALLAHAEKKFAAEEARREALRARRAKAETITYSLGGVAFQVRR